MVSFGFNFPLVIYEPLLISRDSWEMILEMDKRFSGPWLMEKMEVWDNDSVNLLGPANITFDDDGLGSFQFIAVVGFIDCRFSERDGLPFVEFSWQGHDDDADACGRGWGIIERDGKLHGRIFIHCADDSAFTAKPA